MDDQIHLLTRSEEEPSCSRVGLLFEAAMDSASRTRHPGAPELRELIGEPGPAKEAAYRIARLLLANEPPLRGVPQLSVFEEPIIGELQAIVHANHLVDWLVANGLRSCRIGRSSKILEYAEVITRARDLPLCIDAGEASDSSPASALGRSWRRLAGAHFERAALASEFRQAIDRLDPFHRHERARRPRRVEAGRVWFYTTAYTYTRAGLALEPYTPDGLLYLVENPLTGGAPLRAIRREFWSPYPFGRRGDEPSAKEVQDGCRQIEGHVAEGLLPPGLEVMRTALLEGPLFRTFRDRFLPSGLFMSTTAERFLEETRPRAIVVGNPGFERYLLHRARSVGIPTILIQHGILGDYCQLLDPPVDHYLVRGSFWKEFLSPEARQRAQVLNPHRNRPGASAAGSRDRRLVFLTAPSRADSPWDEGEVDEILRVLLSAVGDCGGRLVVRVHPQEQLGTYRARVSRLRLGGEPPGDLVTFSQGGAIDEVLSGAAAAITYSSTAFLDCVQMKVPIISFGWHDFAYRRLIERHGVFTFCAGLAELGSVARRALREGIEPYSGEADFLDERTPDENLRRVLAKILGPPNGPAHLH